MPSASLAGSSARTTSVAAPASTEAAVADFRKSRRWIGRLFSNGQSRVQNACGENPAKTATSRMPRFLQTVWDVPAWLNGKPQSTRYAAQVNNFPKRSALTTAQEDEATQKPRSHRTIFAAIPHWRSENHRGRRVRRDELLRRTESARTSRHPSNTATGRNKAATTGVLTSFRNSKLRRTRCVQVAAERSLLAPWLPVSLVGVMIRGDVPARWNVAFSSMKIRPVCDSATTGLAERGTVKKSDRRLNDP